MKIQLNISTHTLGENSAEDNQRYANAVQTALQTEYPKAEVAVELKTHVTNSYCVIAHCDVINALEVEDIQNNVHSIAKRIWDRSVYQ